MKYQTYNREMGWMGWQEDQVARHPIRNKGGTV